MQNTVSFTPVTVTVETLQVLAKEKNYANLLALYMACVEITTWQKNNSIKASMSFMEKRLHWGEARLRSTKAQLVELGLLENIVRKDDVGKVTGHYVLVKHIIHPPSESSTGKSQGVVSEGTSANDLQLSANDIKPPKKSEQQNEALLDMLNKSTNRSFRVLPNGTKKLLSVFSLVEVENALAALAADPWHKERLKELPSSYFLRATTIDRFLAVMKKTEEDIAREQKERVAKMQKAHGYDDN